MPQVSLTQAVVVPTGTSPCVVSIDLPIMSSSLPLVQTTQISTHFSLINSVMRKKKKMMVKKARTKKKKKTLIKVKLFVMTRSLLPRL